MGGIFFFVTLGFWILSAHKMVDSTYADHLAPVKMLKLPELSNGINLNLQTKIFPQLFNGAL